MSCNICHTPILVDRRYLNPIDKGMITQLDHLDPIVARVCPIKEHQPYFRKVVHIDCRHEGIVMPDLVHAGLGVFMSHQWSIIPGGLMIRTCQEDVSLDGVTSKSV
jgi:hypothetical protein